MQLIWYQQLAHEEAKLGEKYPLQCVRLRSYNPSTGTLGATFSGSEDTSLIELEIFSQRCFLLETRSIEDSWPAENEAEVVLKVIPINELTLELGEAITVSLVATEATLGNIKLALQEKVKLNRTSYFT